MNRIYNFLSRNTGILTFLLCLVFYILPFKPKPFGDGEYHRGTLQLLDYISHGFTGQVEVSKGFFTLLYYAIPYSLTAWLGNQKILLLAGLLFNWLAVSYGVQRLLGALREAGLTPKLCAGVFVLMNLFPIHIYYSMGILSEAPAFLLVSLFVGWLYRVYQTPASESTWKPFLYCGIFLALFISVRPNFLPFVVPFFIVVLFRNWNWKQKGMLIGSVFIPLTVFFLIEKKLDNTDAEFKKFQLVKGFVWSRYELRDEPFNWLPQHGMDAYASLDYKNNLKKRVELLNYCKANNLDLQKHAFDWMWNDIKSHPGLFLRQTFLKYFQSQTFVVTPLMKSKKPALLKWGIHIYINVVNYILLFTVLYSLVIYFRNRSELAVFVPLFLFYATAFITIFFLHSEQRYVFPTRPATLFMLGLTWYHIIKQRESKPPQVPQSI
jgi:hypothetical protein